MFYSCECGYYNCGICGPVIESINENNRKKEKAAEKEMKELNILAGKLTMPFGKYKGRLLHDVPRSYLSWVSNNCSLKDNDLKKVIYFLLKDYRPSNSRTFYSSDIYDDLDPHDLF